MRHSRESAASRLAIVAFALVSSFGGGCWCESRDDERARIEKPASARLVGTTTEQHSAFVGCAAFCVGARGGSRLHSETHLNLLTDRPNQKIRLPDRWSCPTPRLSADPEGRRIAVHCNDEAHIVYLDEPGFPSPRSFDVRGRNVDWSSVPEFAAARGRLFEAYVAHEGAYRSLDDDERLASDNAVALLAAVQRSGEATFTAFLVEHAGVPIAASERRCRPADKRLYGEPRSTWRTAYDRLSEAARADVLARLRERAADRGAPVALVVRALLLDDLRGPGLTDAIEAQLDALARTHRPPDEPVELLLVRLAQERPESAARLACQLADTPSMRSAVLIVAAHGKARCPPLDALLGEADVCASVEAGVGATRPIDPDELARKCAAAVTDPGWRERVRCDDYGVSPWFAAAFANGPPPRGFTRRIDRLSYAIEQPETPACDAAPSASAGTPCKCSDLVRREVCRLSIEQTDAFALGCGVKIDDGARTIRPYVRQSDAGTSP